VIVGGSQMIGGAPGLDSDPAASTLAQNLLQRLGEFAGLAHEAAVVAGEHDRIDAKLLGEREPGAVGELTLGGGTDACDFALPWIP
jgi:hypothetical protein